MSCAVIAYDANGNTLTDASGRSFTWDFENRLTQIVNPGVGTTTFKYDPFGRRIQKSGPNGTTNYLYDRVNLIEEADSNGNVTARYTQGPTIDNLLAEFRGSATSFYQADALGSVTALSNLAATLTNTYIYDSFGRLIASTGTIPNPFQYTGREFDPEAGLHELRARYYDQSVGRFISEDPVRFTAGIDFYTYVGNRAASSMDPLGLAASSGGVWGWASSLASKGHDAWNTGKEKAHQIVCWVQYEYCIHGAFDNLYATSQASQGAPVYTPDELANPTQNNEFSHGAHQVMQCLRGDNCKKVLDDCLLGWISSGMFPH